MCEVVYFFKRELPSAGGKDYHTGVRENKLTSKERPNPKSDAKPSLLPGLVIFQAKLNIQAIRENNSLLLLDSLVIIEISHNIDKCLWITRVLAYPGKYFRVRFFSIIRAGKALKELLGTKSIG